MRAMIHHLGVFASDFAASRPFYVAALWPLGIQVGHETDGIAEFWLDRVRHAFSVAGDGQRCPDSRHAIAFIASTRHQVDEFYDSAMKAGASPRHAPRHWPEYGAYCAFVSDPDGNNSEAVHKEGT